MHLTVIKIICYLLGKLVKGQGVMHESLRENSSFFNGVYSGLIFVTSLYDRVDKL